ncbi:MAG: GerMN domain-containing protein [Chloroflexota bacterium]|jgi:germination protein M
MRRGIALVALLAIVAVVVTGCRLPWQKVEPEGDADTDAVSVVLYFGDKNGEKLVREVREVKRDAGNAELTKDEIAIRELIKGPANANLVKTVPAEAELLSLRIENGIAYANFSEEIRTKHWGGSTGELMTVASIVNTLTENPAITKVQFLVEGRVEDSIWGHGITSEPIPRNEDIISK